MNHVVFVNLLHGPNAWHIIKTVVFRCKGFSLLFYTPINVFFK